MAVQRNKADKMTLKVMVDQDASGKVTYGNRTINRVNPAVTDEDVRLCGLAFANLQKYELESVSRTISYELAAE